MARNHTPSCAVPIETSQIYAPAHFQPYTRVDLPSDAAESSFFTALPSVFSKSCFLLSVLTCRPPPDQLALRILWFTFEHWAHPRPVSLPPYASSSVPFPAPTGVHLQIGLLLDKYYQRIVVLDRELDSLCDDDIVIASYQA